MASEMLLLARHVAMQGRAEEAERLALDGIALREGLLGRRHPAYATGIAGLAVVYAELGRFPEAIEQQRKSLEARHAAGEDEAGFGEAYRDLGRYLTAAGRYDEAEATLLRSLEELEAVHGPDHPNPLATRRALSELYTAWGRDADAARYRVPEDTGRFSVY